MEEKKRKILTIGLPILIVVLLLVAGASFAVWQIILKQTGENTLTVGCFAIEFTDLNPINIGSAYPITDEDGKKLTPYEFTITNTCAGNASFQTNLEILDTTTLERLEYIKILFNEKDKAEEAKILGNQEVVQKTLDNAITSYQLNTGIIGENETKTYELRMWLDENTPASNEIMNRTISSKVTITTAIGSGENPSTPGGDTPGIPETPVVVTDNVNYIKSKIEEGTFLEDDETEDHNMRFIGANPNNYVSFNNELWRIIGYMNNIDDGTGKKETRIKLIRNESIGNFSWDSSASNINYSNSGTTYYGYGVNEWSQADIMKLMNPGYETEAIGGSLYWHRASGRCYNDYTNRNTACNFSTTGIQEESKTLFENAVWHTGTTDTTTNTITASEFYKFERSDNIGKICSSKNNSCNDEVERTTTWTGLIGLMYASDYGYATSGGATMRVTCLANSLSQWSNSGLTDCRANDWLYKENSMQWLMTPKPNSRDATDVFYIYANGTTFNSSGTSHSASNGKYVYPTIYLKSSVQIVSGEGTKESPYQISL